MQYSYWQFTELALNVGQLQQDFVTCHCTYYIKVLVQLHEIKYYLSRLHVSELLVQVSKLNCYMVMGNLVCSGQLYQDMQTEIPGKRARIETKPGETLIFLYVLSTGLDKLLTENESGFMGAGFRCPSMISSKCCRSLQ